METAERITQGLEARPEIFFALLFGSRSRDRARSDSDWDVAVFLDPELTPQERFRKRLALISEVEEAVAESGEQGEADVVVLNDAPALLAHRALMGKRLFVRDKVRYVRFYVRTLRESLDEQHWRDLQARELRQRLVEGTFGRP